MTVKRGYVPTDSMEFNEESLVILRKAQEELLFLLERGYSIKSASTFVGNHYLLSERQRMAVVRATATKSMIELRRSKLLTKELVGNKVSIDGLNVIITLEVALSGSTLLRCMDETIRDLAGLRGTYRLIDQTDVAIQLIGEKLADLNIKEVTFFLDAPVSNTGRLKSKIFDVLNGSSYQVNVELVNNADVILEQLNHVISSDSIVLNKCESWINLVAEILEEKLPEVKYVDLGMNNSMGFSYE